MGLFCGKKCKKMQEDVAGLMNGGGGAEVHTVKMVGTTSASGVNERYVGINGTYADIMAAYEAGKIINCVYEDTERNSKSNLLFYGFSDQYNTFDFLHFFMDGGWGCAMFLLFRVYPDSSIKIVKCYDK